MRYAYPADVFLDDEGRTAVALPDFSDLVVSGDDRGRALAAAAAALGKSIAAAINEQRPIPSPSAARGRPLVAPSAQMAAKAALYTAMRETKTTKVALAAGLACQESEVRRMLDPDHPTKIGRLEQALGRFDRRIILSVEGVE